MAGVVRRDGLREAVTALRDEWLRVARENEVTPAHATSLEWRAREVTVLLDAVPDVPPRPSEPSDGLSGDLASKSPTDPPAADELLDGAIRTLLPGLLVANYVERWATGSPAVQALSILSEHLGEGPVAAGETVDPDVLSAHSRRPAGDPVDAADVRARAQEAAWDEGWSAARQVVREQKPGDNPYRNRAVSEREGASDG